MRTLEARGVELAFEELGAAAPRTVFVHETGTGAAAWRPIAERLAALGAGAVVYDRRGWGASSAPGGYRRTTVEEQSEDLAELIAAVGPVATVCGAGLGGLIALDLALRRPREVEAVVLVEPLVPGLVPSATEAMSQDREALRDAVHGQGEAGMVELYLDGGLAALGPGVERLPAGIIGEARKRPASLAAELGAAAVWSHPLQDLSRVRQTVGIVTCADTPPILREAADALAERLANPSRGELPAPGPPHLRDADWMADLISSAVPR